MRSILSTAALSALLHSTVTSAAALQTCSTTNVCFSVAVPEAAASSGSGNLYFQIEAPTSYTWVALGTGSRMSGSNLFIMYTDGTGNVTVSPRLGTNHVMPTEDTSSTKAALTLLAGSGVDGDTMRANVLCTNCNSWNGGTMSLSSTSSSWVSAWKSGSSLDSTSKSASIQQHDSTDSFNINLQKATISSDSNPFVTAAGNSSTGSSSGSTSGDSSNSGSSSGITKASGNNSTPQLIAAHGVIMAITFVIMYPIGSVLMPLLGKWAIHAAWQLVTFVLMWIGFGLGVVASQKTFINFTASHTVFGTVIVVLMIVQPALGFAHHRQYMKTQQRGMLSIVHMAYGRLLMLFGVINGGLGLQLAGASQSLVVAYAIVSVIIGVIYTSVKLFFFFKQRNAGGVRAEKILSNGTTGRRKYSQTIGEEIEMPRRS